MKVDSGMTVLHLCLSGGMGGLELYPVKVLKWQKEVGVFCHAVVPPKSFIAEKLQKEDIPYSTLKRWSEYIPFLAAYRLARLVDAMEIDILHMHHRADLLTAAMGKCLSRRPVKLVYTRHMGMSRAKKDIYHAFLFRHVDRFIAITKLIYKQLASNLPVNPDKICQLYYGIPQPPEYDVRNCGELYSKAVLSEKDFKVGMFGRIAKGKGHKHLVNAVKSLLGKGYDVGAVIVGTATDEACLESMLESIKTPEAQGRIFYYGFHERPMEIMGCFDVVVLASDLEAFGLVLIEAMRCGTTVVGTDACGVPEIIKDGETGLLVKPRESESLEAALERLIKDPELCRSLAVNGKKFADEMFSEEEHFHKLEKIYEEVLD
jgi:glycosyltransferase involved in cell wall biosynthesis